MDNSFLYCISDNTGHCKFGYSNDPHKRLKQLQTGNIHTLTLLHTIPVPKQQVKILESKLHKEINYKKIKGEWFNIDNDQAINLLTWFEIHYIK